MNESDIRVLIADNQPLYASQCAQFLSRAGYVVFEAHSIEDARNLLEQRFLHVALLDLRLVNDSDPNDLSGLRLATTIAPSVAKVILTGYPGFETARSALMSSAAGSPPALGYLDKREGFDAILATIRAVVSRLGVNHHLEIEWDVIDSHSIIRKILPGPDEQTANDQNFALIDVLRRAFADYDRVRVSRVIWARDSRLALEVKSWHLDKGQSDCLVICGSSASIDSEARAFTKYAPSTGGSVPHLRYVATSSAIGAIVYEYPTRLDSSPTFADVYRSGGDSIIQNALRSVFVDAVAPWHTGHPVLPIDGPASRHRDPGGPFPDLSGIVTKCLRDLNKAGVSIEIKPLVWGMSIKGRSLTVPNPEITFSKLSSMSSRPVLQCSPGAAHSETLLVLPSGIVFATDFGRAGLQAWARVYASMECAIRFDLWVSADPLEDIQVEEELCKAQFVFPQALNESGAQRKLAKAIAAIRQLVAERIRSDPPTYQIEIFKQIADRLAALALHSVNTDVDVNRLVHLIIGAALWSQSVGLTNGRLSSRSGLKILRERRAVSIGGAVVDLSRQSFALLSYLHCHSEQVCSREELVTNVFGQVFDPDDKSQEDRLNTAIYRLRERVEPDKGKPIYLLSVNDGYSLRPNPAD